MSTFPFTVSDRSLWKTPPAVVTKVVKAKAADQEWKLLCRRVDERDKKTCQVTGAKLTAGAVDAWKALERHHLELRSQNKGRALDIANLWTVARAVHQLIHAGLLLVLDKHGEKATDVREIKTIRWNRERVEIGKEPFRLKSRKGWFVADVHSIRKPKV